MNVSIEDELFVKEYLKGFFLRNENLDLKNSQYKKFQTIKKKMDPYVVLELTSAAIFEEFLISSDNYNLSYLTPKKLL